MIELVEREEETVPAFEIAEVARQKLESMRLSLRWWRPFRKRRYINLLGQAAEQLLGQYHHDNKPKESNG